MCFLEVIVRGSGEPKFHIHLFLNTVFSNSFVPILIYPMCFSLQLLHKLFFLKFMHSIILFILSNGFFPPYPCQARTYSLKTHEKIIEMKHA